MIITTTKPMRQRMPHDHYPTRKEVIRAAYQQVLPPAFRPRAILDHSAGTGIWGVVAREVWPLAHVTGVEVQPSRASRAYDAWFAGWDFARYAVYARMRGIARPDLIVGNPPFSLAEPFVRLSLAMLAPGGFLLQYLRLAFLEGQARGAGLWQEHCPQSVDTLSRRPSHMGNRKTDATAYAVYLWQQGHLCRRYSGGWLIWDYAHTIYEEEQPFRPFPLLPVESPVVEAPVRQLSFLESCEVHDANRD